MKKICSRCRKPKKYIFYRKLIDNGKTLLCDSCYRKHLKICSLCNKHKPVYTYSKKNKPICRTCYLNPYNTCKNCGTKFPAGVGRICVDCSYYNMLKKKLNKLYILLSNYTNHIFEYFIWWLVERRGIKYSANYIQKYFIFFYKLDSISYKLKKFPKYNELLEYIHVSETRKFLLITNFLSEKKLINIDHKIKDFYANLNMIESYNKTFDVNTAEYLLIKKYSNYLFSKYEKKLIKLRSIRLTLTPAVKLLKYKQYFNSNNLTDNIINGYLWIYPGQRSALTGFINFLNKFKKLHLNKDEIILERPQARKKQLQLRLVYLLKKDTLSEYEKRRLIHISIEYFHRIKVPKNVYLNKGNIFKFDTSYFICCCKNKFYLPNTVYLKLTQS